MSDPSNKNSNIVPIPCAFGADKLTEKNNCFSCSNCDRKILDFRDKNSEEIKEELDGNEGACIMVNDDRDPYLDHQNIHKLRTFLVASVLVFGSTLYSNAQEIAQNIEERYEIVQKDSAQLYGFQFTIFPRLKRTLGGRSGRFMPEANGFGKGRILKKVDRVTVTCDSLGFKQTFDDMFMDEDGWLMLDLSDLPLGDSSLENSRAAYLIFEIPGYKPVNFHLNYLRVGKENSRYVFHKGRKNLRYRVGYM